MAKRVTFFIAFGILALAAFFRFSLITEIPVGLYPDEAMNGNNALEALATGEFKVFYPENNGREGLFVNLQAFSLSLLGNEPWVLRIVSAIVGTLTVLGIYLLTRELFPNVRNVALLSAFFLATNFWHINFSRIGFRAILVPLLASFGMYFLLKSLRQGKILDLVWAGIFIGLGFHTYIAFRFMPFVILVPLTWYLWQWGKRNPSLASHCAPCGALLLLFVVSVTALPIGLYFLQHPQDFVGRVTGISVFATESPLQEFAKSTVATLGMLVLKGDCNWRHNLACEPELHPIVSLSFLIGFIAAARNIASNRSPLASGTLLAWFFFFMLPATLTYEGLPHALRSIGMIVPSMVLAGQGAWLLIVNAISWLEREKRLWPRYENQLNRIRKEVMILAILVLLVVPLATYRDYFIRWAANPNTYFAFTTDLWHLGQFLNALPQETKKYVVVNLPGVIVRGIPMPAQTVMFATDTFREETRATRNIRYLLPEESGAVTIAPGEKVLITFLNGEDRALISFFQKRFPTLRAKTPGDFVVLQN